MLKPPTPTEQSRAYTRATLQGNATAARRRTHEAHLRHHSAERAADAIEARLGDARRRLSAALDALRDAEAQPARDAANVAAAERAALDAEGLLDAAHADGNAELVAAWDRFRGAGGLSRDNAPGAIRRVLDEAEERINHAERGLAIARDTAARAVLDAGRAAAVNAAQAARLARDADAAREAVAAAELEHREALQLARVEADAHAAAERDAERAVAELEKFDRKYPPK